VLQTLTSAGLPTSALTVEIAEAALGSGSAVVLHQLEQLRAQGVGVSIDDFGAGRASLNHLARLPVDELKIDRELVGRIDGRGDSGFVRAIVGSATALGLRPVAEGVETHTQARLLHALGCRHAQGWLFARPRTPEQLPGLCATTIRPLG
jgi:EAL domain-containing protein (putative c-di-GMP-specific phosphodiesterase class I)